ncbi:MAG: glycosyltransferase family 4 protein [Sphingobacteriaceae bacterium]|jgi:glycosyltransferase involved in cell wall biosynthesis
MPKVLILVAHRPQRSPSQRYRFEQYLPFLQSHGYEFTWSYLLNEKDDKVFYSSGHFVAKVLIMLKGLLMRYRDVQRFNEFDLIFIQREATFFGTSYFEKKAKASGKKVIFDFDDAIWIEDTSPGNQKWKWLKNTNKFNTNVACANIVIAGNAYLANKAKEYNKIVLIIPTTVDTSFHIPKPQLRNKEKVTIGWSGSISTIKHFESVVPVLIKLKEKFNDHIQFKVLGDEYYTNEKLNIKGLSWSAQTEVDVLNTFDIGLMPLPDDAWANGKCGLKALTYMACGVPVVTNPVGVNKEIIQHLVNGFLVNTEEEWLKVLEELIHDQLLREKVGYEGSRTVKQFYSVEANKDNYLKAFNNA